MKLTNTKTVMGVPAACFWMVLAVCVTGIVIGSFYDFEISEAVASKTDIGKTYATWCQIAPYFFYTAAGACIFTGLRRKGRALAWLILVMIVIYAVNKSESSYGSYIRALFGYRAGETSVIRYLLSWLFWVAAYGAVALIMVLLLDDSDPDKLIAVGLSILMAGIITNSVNSWLKLFAGRPRYKYLLKLDDPRSEFRQWWQMVPQISSSDNFKSWPSGHMTSTGILFTLPMLTDCMKKRSLRKNITAFLIASILALITGYNRIHMTNHFLPDVCSGCLITYLIFSSVSTVFLRTMSRYRPQAENGNAESGSS